MCSHSCGAQIFVAAWDIVKENKDYFIAMNNFFLLLLFEAYPRRYNIVFFSKMIVESRLNKSGLHFIPTTP